MASSLLPSHGYAPGSRLPIGRKGKMMSRGAGERRAYSGDNKQAVTLLEKPMNERRIFPEIEHLSLPDLEWTDPWNFVSDADRKKIEGWGGNAFHRLRRSSDQEARQSSSQPAFGEA
jgi:hypothetical protein